MILVPGADNPGFWKYRRLIDPSNFTGRDRTAITLVNWPMNDYLEGQIFDLPPKEIAENLENSRQQSLSLFVLDAN